MTFEEAKSEETKQTLADLNRILKRFNPESKAGEIAVYAQFTNDVDGGETRYNRDIASELIKNGLMTPQV